MYHIPICPFSQRVEILLELKGMTGAVDFEVVDVTRPRPDWLLAKTGGATAMPILETPEGKRPSPHGLVQEFLEDLRGFLEAGRDVPARAMTDEDLERLRELGYAGGKDD